jgi:hypothetical protein
MTGGGGGAGGLKNFAALTVCGAAPYPITSRWRFRSWLQVTTGGTSGTDSTVVFQHIHQQVEVVEQEIQIFSLCRNSGGSGGGRIFSKMQLQEQEILLQLVLHKEIQVETGSPGTNAGGGGGSSEAGKSCGLLGKGSKVEQEQMFQSLDQELPNSGVYAGGGGWQEKEQVVLVEQVEEEHGGNRPSPGGYSRNTRNS